MFNLGLLTLHRDLVKFKELNGSQVEKYTRQRVYTKVSERFMSKKEKTNVSETEITRVLRRETENSDTSGYLYDWDQRDPKPDYVDET